MGRGFQVHALVFFCSFLQSQADVIRVINIQGLPLQQRLAASVLVGLLNRQAQQPSALGLINPSDQAWLGTALAEEPVLNASTVQQVQSLAKLGDAARNSGALLARVLYNPEEGWSLAAVVTLAGVHRAVPVPASGANASDDAQLASFGALPVAFDARGRWPDAAAATAWAMGSLHPLCNETDALIVLQEPQLLQAGFLADLVASRQLFAFHLPDMCDEGSASAALFDALSAGARAQGKLLSVMGYYPQQEVVALCSRHHTEISLVADYCSSLSFWSRIPGQAAPLLQAPQLPPQTYSARNTYVAIVASDGDNMQMAFNVKRARMEERLGQCGRLGAACPPMTWTVSNRLAEFAPTVLRWFFRQAAQTGRDAFLMGPSGYGFLHPGMIDVSEPALNTLVNQTLAAAALLSTSAYVHWDEYGNYVGAPPQQQPPSWNATSPAPEKSASGAAQQQQEQLVDFLRLGRYAAAQGGSPSATGTPSDGGEGGAPPLRELAMERYLRRFEGSAIRTVLSPIMPFVPDRIGSLRTFREVHRWFGGESAAKVGAALGRLPRGTLGYVYKIPDVGLDAVEALARAVPAHVQLVGYRELAQLADSKQALQLAGLGEPSRLA